MTGLSSHPSTAELRKNLDAYVIAVGRGEEFRLYRYKTAIGIIGAPSVLSKKDRAKAVELSFTEARDSLVEVRRLVMDGKAIVITKAIRIAGVASRKEAKKSRAGKQANRPVLAIRPLPETGFLEAILEEIREAKSSIGQIGRLFSDYMATNAVLGKARVLKILDEEIEELKEEAARCRAVLDNLNGTAKRLGVGG